MGLTMPEEEIVALMNRYAYDEYAYRIEAKPYVIETRKALKRGGGGRPSRADGKPVDEIRSVSHHYIKDFCVVTIFKYLSGLLTSFRYKGDNLTERKFLLTNILGYVTMNP